MEVELYAALNAILNAILDATFDRAVEEFSASISMEPAGLLLGLLSSLRLGLVLRLGLLSYSASSSGSDWFPESVSE